MADRIKQGGISSVIGLALLAAAAFLALGAPAQALPLDQAPVYAIDDYPFQKAPALQRWRSVLEREAALMAKADPEECKAGEPRIACAAKEALLLEEKLKDKSPVEQVEAVYAYFNAVRYKEHDPQCGVDCWKTRIEFLADREGDCGDHALAEYFTLKRLGFKERDLQLIVAQMPGFADSFKGGHVVLRVRAEGEYFILDNRRNELADLSGLSKYKVLAGMNADSVQIYNLVTPAPPAGFIADAKQVAALVTSPGRLPAFDPSEADVQVAEATPGTFATQSKPTLVAATAPAEVEPVATRAAASASASFEDDSDMACMQAANLADWNPFLPCTPTKVMKIVVKPKIIIGAEPPKTVVVAAVQPAPEAAAPKVTAPKAPEPKIVAKTVVVAPEPPAAAAAEVEAAEEDDSDSCIQGATLADWNPDLPCTADGNASSLRIQVNE